MSMEIVAYHVVHGMWPEIEIALDERSSEGEHACLGGRLDLDLPCRVSDKELFS